MITVIFVNYRKSELTVHACESLANLKGAERVRALVVDNGSTTESLKGLDPLKRVKLAIDVLPVAENLGYFGGARRGLESMKQKGWESHWTIISNSDIDFPDADFVEKLEKINSHGDIGVVGPRVLSSLSGRDQNPYMLNRPPRSRMHFYKWVFRFQLTCFIYQMLGLLKSLIKNSFKGAPKHASEKTPERCDLYAVHGSFLIFSQRYFEVGGDFAHRPFLFGEEVTVAERCRRLGLRVVYEPALSIRHVEHATMGWIPSPLVLRCQREASAYCADEFFSS